jgi:hypothetical protein
MKNTALTILCGFIFSFFYCEGMDILLKDYTLAPLNIVVMCDGSATSIESSETVCEETNADLTIINTMLHSLEMFSAIETVNGNIIIESNNLLNNINGLNQLKYVDKDFIINDNEKLTEAEVRRVILKILNENKGYIGGNIILNHTILDLEIYVTTDI